MHLVMERPWYSRREDFVDPRGLAGAAIRHAPRTFKTKPPALSIRFLGCQLVLVSHRTDFDSGRSIEQPERPQFREKWLLVYPVRLVVLGDLDRLPSSAEDRSRVPDVSKHLVRIAGFGGQTLCSNETSGRGPKLQPTTQQAQSPVKRSPRKTVPFAQLLFHGVGLQSKWSFCAAIAATTQLRQNSKRARSAAGILVAMTNNRCKLSFIAYSFVSHFFFAGRGRWGPGHQPQRRSQLWVAVQQRANGSGAHGVELLPGTKEGRRC